MGDACRVVGVTKLKAPFPWFGGKSRAAHIVWDRFGDVPNYVEPFAGSLAAGTLSRLAGTGEQITAWMLALQARLRNVRVACGDWSRVLGPSVTEKIGVAGILLDPPYGDTARDPSIYTHDDMSVAADVRAWAIGNGSNPMLRIALCGYEGEHEMPAEWSCVAWKALGGYAAAAGNHDNSRRERIWFSPACLRPQGKLFD